MVTTPAMLYEERVQYIRQDLVKKLNQALDRHAQNADGRITFGHAGDLAYVIQHIGEAISFLEGEEAA